MPVLLPTGLRRSIALPLSLTALGSLFALDHVYSDTPILQGLSTLHTLTSTPTNYCPNPLTHNEIPFPSSYPAAWCQSLPVTNCTDWSVRICTDPSICNAATVIIAATNPSQSCLAPSADLYTDEELYDYVVNTAGPAEFRVKVDGTEIWSTGIGEFDAKKCEYQYKVGIRNSGLAELNIWHFYDHYAAFEQEQARDIWPQMLRRKILPIPYFLPRCSPSCPRYLSAPMIPPHMPGLTANPPPPRYPPPELDASDTYEIFIPTAEASFTAAQPHLPSCSAEGKETLPGSYLPLPRWATQYDFYPDLYQYRLPQTWSGRYAYQPRGCVWRHHGIRAADHTECLKEVGGRVRQVGFYGDSHGRAAFDAMVSRMMGIREYADQSPKGLKKEYLVGGTNFAFFWDPVVSEDLLHLTCEGLSKLDTLVVGLGSHSGSRADSPSTFEYVLKFIPKFDACPGPLPKMVYLLPPPHPPRTDEYFQHHKDHRTETRLEYYRDISRKMIHDSVHWNMVDMGQLLQPFIMHPMFIDSAHYLGIDGHEAVLDELIAKMGICGDAEVDAPEPIAEIF